MHIFDDINGTWKPIIPTPIERISPTQQSESHFFSLFAASFWLYGKAVEVDRKKYHVAIVPGNQKQKASDRNEYKPDAVINVEGVPVGMIDPERKAKWDGIGGWSYPAVNIAVHPRSQQFGKPRNPASRTQKLKALRQISKKQPYCVGWIALHSNACGDCHAHTRPKTKSEPCAMLVPWDAIYAEGGSELLAIERVDTGYGGACYVFQPKRERCVELKSREEFESYFENEIIALIRRRTNAN